MYDTPSSLRQTCLSCVCDSVITEVKAMDNDHHRLMLHTVASSGAMTKDRLSTCDASFLPSDLDATSNCHSNSFMSTLNSSHLTANISESLLTCLSQDGRLTDLLMQEVFRPEICRLEAVSIPDASNLTKKGLRILRGHRVRHLEIIGLVKATINELIGCLGEYTLNNILSLCVARSTFSSTAKFCVVVGLAKLRNLRHLDISHTDITHCGLEIIVEDLPHLQSLNISATKVQDISPLRKCKNRLKSLVMYNLRPQGSETFATSFFKVLFELNSLVKLDISDDMERPIDTLYRGGNSVSSLLRRPDLFSKLKYLDISGMDGIELEDLKRFINYKCHLGEDYALQFLGLVQTGMCHCDAFSQYMSDAGSYGYSLTVTGWTTQEQILNSLQVYADRPAFIQKCLCHLYNYTINDIHDPRVDIIEIILTVMKKHSKVIDIQLAATACLYNLTKGKVADKIHPKWLASVVNSTLRAMEQFPNHQQLQKNALLTLCSDRILQEVTFDRFRCTRLVMESLVNFKDQSMNRMAVAICFILAAKISTKETSTLGAKPIYMETLLGIVKSKVDSATDTDLDIMLKFTLSALWNLTDESPSTCSMFLEKGGLALYMQVLRTFEGVASVETKILGLLNNIAEVPLLRASLINYEFISSLSKLVKSEFIDVSYFAAGIFAHLLSDSNTQWSNAQVVKEQIENELVSVVLSWKQPEIEMVAYRSFNPFLPLLRCHESPKVQLWAVWAINHVCSKNATRYAEMLLQEDTLNLFKQVYRNASENGHLEIVMLCSKTLEVMKSACPHETRRLDVGQVALTFNSHETINNNYQWPQ